MNKGNTIELNEYTKINNITAKKIQLEELKKDIECNNKDGYKKGFKDGEEAFITGGSNFSKEGTVIYKWGYLEGYNHAFVYNKSKVNERNSQAVIELKSYKSK